ncbi:MAG: tRNA (adenosine(37)-N6)-dimethylallyltransferase MiaA [Nevskiaceae bacterium]|jgi:tRNA dimethylallyltransferase|nr:tRNA (adenosine(37)-N6)-dimethylallyltransferase MiaA [Nevskiaceae bacterium]
MNGAAAQPRAIAILGPTGAGKSELAMRIARDLPVEIISVDSAQVYRGLDIGTAKPTPAERAAVPHHLIDIRDPEQVYSAGEFRADALRLMPQIAERGRVPLLVGGTMLYFRALFRGIADLPTADAALRAQIDARAADIGWPALHAELTLLDPAAAARISPNDAQRIQRALEVLHLSGKPLHTHWQAATEQSASNATATTTTTPGWPGHWHIAKLEPASRERLHQQLLTRLEQMVAAGLIDEVRALLSKGTLNDHSPVMRLVGYRQFIAYCRGQQSRESAFQQALAATRQLAKRQLTWLRSATILPEGVVASTIDAFDSQARERLSTVLIQANTTS